MQIIVAHHYMQRSASKGERMPGTGHLSKKPKHKLVMSVSVVLKFRLIFIFDLELIDASLTVN